MLLHTFGCNLAMRRIQSALIFLVVNSVLIPLGHADSFIFSPAIYKDAEAPNFGDVTVVPSYRIHQVYDAEDFEAVGPGPWTITGFDLRVDGDVDEPMEYPTERWTMKLSTTSVEPGELSLTFAENVGPDEVTVLDRSLTVRTENVGPEHGPKVFDYGAEFETPFTFDPSQGNLLADYTILNGVGPLLLDFDFTVNGTTSFIWTDELGHDSLVASAGQFGGHVIRFTVEPGLQAGDADQDLDFDQMDLVKVQVAAKYLTGEAATWGEGDWNRSPGGVQGKPPVGDGLFDQLDVIAALGAGAYLTGPYAAIRTGGVREDGQASLVYNAKSGELAVDAPSNKELTSINIDSAAGKFIGDTPAALSVRDANLFPDNFSSDNIFKATFGMSFGDVSFGNVLPAGLTEADIAADLSVVGSLVGGGDLGSVDFVYIPEPSTGLLTAMATFAVFAYSFRRRSQP